MSSNEELQAKLNQQLQPVRKLACGYRVVNLDSLADFPWTRIYLFSSGDSDPLTADEISQELGFSWRGSELAYQRHRLVFVNQQQVASYVDFSDEDFIESIGLDEQHKLGLPLSFHTCGKAAPEHATFIAVQLARKQARFAAVRSGSFPTDRIHLLPIACLENFRQLLPDANCAGLTAQIIHKLSRPKKPAKQ